MRPSEINTTDRFFDSVWQNTEDETLARNLCVIMQRTGRDSWDPFTWCNYEALCSHNVGHAERDHLDQFVKREYLWRDGDEYVFTRRFVVAVSQFARGRCADALNLEAQQ